MRRFSPKTLTAVMAILSATAGFASAESLSDAFAAAYQSNPTLTAARAGLRATDEGVPAARAGQRPSITATATGQLNETDRANSPSDTSLPLTFSLNASQTLYDGGRTRNAIDSAISDVSAGRANLLSTEQNVLLQVVISYMDVRRDQQFVTLAENNVRLIREQLRAAEDRFAVGEVTRTDVSQASARLAQARSALAQQKGALVRSMQAYRRVVGNPPGALQEPPLLPPAPDSLEEAIQEAMDYHPDIQVAQFIEEAARSDVRFAQGALLPTITLSGTVTVNENQALGNNSTTGVIQLQATVPIYQGGGEYAEVRRTREVVSQRMSQIHEATREIREAVENAWSDLEVARIAIRAGRQQVSAAQLAYEGVTEEAKLGARTTIDVLDAEQELLDARTDLVSSLRDEYVAGYTLLAAVGRLYVSNLDVAVEQYDPENHFNEVSETFYGFKRDELTEWRTQTSP
ncbi:MAG: TolC family outer membrane protein [Pikeienuella sp.]